MLGVGFGWNEDELADHGVTMGDRRAVTREHVLAMQALWRDDIAGFEGDHVAIAPSWSWPKPAAGSVPVLIGGSAGPKLFAHIAEYAQGWIPIGGAGLGTAIPELQRVVAGAGRDPATLKIVPFGSIPDPGKLRALRHHRGHRVRLPGPVGGGGRGAAHPRPLGRAHRLSSSGHAGLGSGHADDVTTVQLAAPPGLDLAVDLHLTRLDERLGVGTGVHQVGQLEELTEPDHLVADGDVLHQGTGLSGTSGT